MTAAQLELQVKLITLSTDDKYTSGFIQAVTSLSGETTAKATARMAEGAIQNYPQMDISMGDGDLLGFVQLNILKYELSYNIV